MNLSFIMTDVETASITLITTFVKIATLSILRKEYVTEEPVLRWEQMITY